MNAPNSTLKDIAALIRRESSTLLRTWQDKVRELPSASGLDAPTLLDHVPGLLDELATALETNAQTSIADALITNSAPEHGRQRLQDGFDIQEVVAEYNILRGCLHDLTETNQLPLIGKSFHIVNRMFDGAIGLAVKAFATSRAREIQVRRDQYLAFVAHDLKTPLNAIALATRVLERVDPGPPDGQQARMLRALDRNVRQLEGLVSAVLEEHSALSDDSVIKLERRDLDLWSLVEGMTRDLEPAAQAAGSRLVNLVPDHLTAYADAAVLRRILQNLLANAIKYTARGEIIVGADAEGDRIECWIADNGTGIPAERLATVFDAFVTDPAVAGGTGLGLSIVKAYVEAHGGRVEVESREHAGSTFRFSLPGRSPASSLSKFGGTAPPPR